jgi:hypothetical protein
MESHIQSYLRVVASHQRDTERIGPFLATFSRANDNPFLNYAIPDDNATPSPADVAALIVAYTKRSCLQPTATNPVPCARLRAIALKFHVITWN